MKIFFYKSVLILFLFLIGFHYSFNYVVKTTKRYIESTISKENIEHIKKKIKDEMKVAVNKDKFISTEDANLINQFLDKVFKDLDKN